MKDVKPVCMTIANHFKHNKRSCPTTNEEKERMASVPYSLAVESVMYAMVIAHAKGLVIRFY